MNVLEIPNALLDVIYDAATEPALWPRALTMIADLTGSQGALLHGASFVQGFVGFMHMGRLDDECNRIYQQYHLINPWSDYMRLQPAGTLLRSDDIVPLAELRRSPLYANVQLPQQTEHSAMASLFSRADFIGAFCLTRSAGQGAFGPYEMAVLRRLLPHMQRAVNLAERVEGYRLLQRANAEALDGLATGILLLDTQGDLLFANRAGSQMTADAGPLGVRDGRIFARAAASQNALAAALRTGASGEPVAAFRMLASGPQVRVAIQPVRSLDRDRLRVLAHRSPAMIMFATQADDAAATPAKTRLLTEVFGLTPAEIRVALPAANGVSPGAIADALQLTRNTVKTHLKRVYSKTQVRRQAELMRLLSDAAQLAPHGVFLADARLQSNCAPDVGDANSGSASER